ncbi:YhjD/YihY/BrkB family envelope integrity protein [Phaeacidiphilus oryzae]|uniref:YhjD/YihY/BrkB family envelope integrity protein n=1 Tax=Phaeacidiphilus oryzae TaxID=348818 RepID=UPI0007C87C77|nr:YhjD/YihY/BrkB family envelope integrity protein [Phaeacidiphilus oryzae]
MGPVLRWGAGLWQRGQQLELLHRGMGFAALGVVTMMPLLVLVADAIPTEHASFAQWLIDGMGLEGQPAESVRSLFASPGRVLGTTSVLSLVVLWFFGLSFAGSVQTGYEKIWGLPSGPWHKVWRQALWLVLVTLYLDATAQSWNLLGNSNWEESLRFLSTVGTGVLFFWWGPHFLLGGRVPWRSLWWGAVATVLGLIGLRGFSVLVFSPLLVSNAVTYGAAGVLLVVQSWLVGVGFVVYGGALVGERLSRRGVRVDEQGREIPEEVDASPGDGASDE